MTESKSRPLDIVIDRDEQMATVTVSGEVDLESSTALREALATTTDCSLVRLDLSAVDYMDSTGLRTVLVAREERRAAGGALEVAAASGIVTRLIEISGVDNLLRP